MRKEIENLKLESVVQKRSTYGKIEKRKTNTFNIRLTGKMDYFFPDKHIPVSAGEMIFLPKGSTYHYKTATEEESKCVIINLEGEFERKEPITCSLKDFRGMEMLSSHFADAWNFGNSAEKYQCMSLLYELLSYISNVEALQYADKKKFRLIEPAVAYLKEHIYDTALKMDELHLMCGISDTYFRKIFHLRFGKSPKNYAIEKRVSHAKSLIDSGEFKTVQDLAKSVGYVDPLYFGKVFKKHYGVSPRAMNHME